MKTNVFKLIIGGMLLGAAAFFVPFFIFKVAAFFFVVMLFFWLFRGRKHYQNRMAWVENVRNMSDEEFETWKSQRGRCGGHRSSKNQDHE